MADRKCMHAALKKIIVPDLRARGFKGRYPHFRRIAATHTDLLNFQFDKYHRDLFVINITQAPGSGMYTTRLGDQFHRDNLKYFQVTESTYRLQPKSIGGADDWFAYAQENYDEIARSILPYIKRADQWFADTSDTEGLAPPVIRKPSDRIAPATNDRNQHEYERLVTRLSKMIEDNQKSNPGSELRMEIVSPCCSKIYRPVFFCALEIAYIVVPADGTYTPGLRMTTATKCLEFKISTNGQDLYWFTTDLTGERRRMNEVALAAFIFQECLLPM